jgi:hypothetical protein
MGPAEIAGHLDERFRLLTGGRRSRVERHQTLRAAVEWSYSLLGDSERLVFDRLGVFPASFDEAAAIAVCATGRVERWDVIDGLASLVAKSMVGLERAGDTTRYRLLETLRHYARERIAASEELDGLRRRHAAHFAALAEVVGAGLMSRDELAWRSRASVELDNFRAAASWAFDAAASDDVGLGVRVIDGLVMDTISRLSWGVQAWATSALPRVDELDSRQRAVVLGAAANDFLQRGDLDQAKELGERSIAESETFTPALAVAFTAVGVAMAASGDMRGAMTLFADCRGRLQVSGGNEWHAGLLHVVTAWPAYMIGDHATAASEARHGLTAARQLRIPSLLAGALAIHARTVSENDPRQAVAEAEESVRLIEAGAGDANYTASLATIAIVRESQGDNIGAARAMHTLMAHDARDGRRLSFATYLPLAVNVLAGAPHSEQAVAILGGTVGGPALGRFQSFLAASDLDRYNDALTRVSATLGPESYADARRRGATMSYDEIVSFTLTHLARIAHTD